MKSAIVTGATGFIGSWFVERLLRENVLVTALVTEGEDRLEQRVRDAINIIHYKPESIFDIQEDIKGADTFYNIGWAGVVPEHKNNVNLQMASVQSAISALQYASDIGCTRFIGIGTVAEYVYCDGLIEACQLPSPADFYGAAKVSTHFMSQQLARQLGIGFNWAIIPSTFGARRDDNNIITYTIRSLLKKERPSYTKLEQMWDFLHVSDVAKALWLIGESGGSGKTYGIGSGVHRPLHEYIESIRDMIDRSLPLGIGDKPYPQGKISSSCVDIRELAKDTGFNPEVSFEDGIMNTIRYFERELL